MSACEHCLTESRRHAQTCPLRPAPPPPRKLPPCRHCGARAANRARKLCSVCYGDPAVRPLYRPGRGNPRPAASRVKAPPKRKPGEPCYRCLYCSRFRCDGPLRLCGRCQDEYLERAGTMPAFGREGGGG